MSLVVSDALRERWKEYMRLREQRALYSACIRLGEVASCVRYTELPPEEVLKWAESLETVTFSPKEAAEIRGEAERRVTRIRRILDSDGALTYEEIMLVLTMRIELDLVLNCPKLGNLDLPDLGTVDRGLLALKGSPKVSSMFAKAQRVAKRNWGLPLQSHWLDEGVWH